MKFQLPKIPYKELLVGPTVGIWFGATLNWIAIATNHGQMPVHWPGGCGSYPDNPDDIIHSCMVASDHLKFLCDWIYLGNGIASIGDLFIFLGNYLVQPFLWMWLALVIRDNHYREGK